LDAGSRQNCSIETGGCNFVSQFSNLSRAGGIIVKKGGVVLARATDNGAASMIFMKNRFMKSSCVGELPRRVGVVKMD
jgi:hypothetical protein